MPTIRHLTAQARYDTPLGTVLIARTEAGLAGLWFESQKWHPAPLDAPERPDDPLLREAATQIADYFAGRRTQFELPLDLHGSPFQRSVWQALRDIDCGATRSYADIARRIGSPQAVRAVGAAIGRNPVSVIVPCHRVLGSSGELTGYAGGLDRKRALLALEAPR
ncbi:methylated-DNA--[protein]-cysteine S-methyltransferase [Rhizobacter sp. J219]|jgi:methylated-DNA-[protein]-cysteine S-methyltransferase|uniref:methylated-DNA--[protein]-cysteine S-methyltransferase n=1 Tax=Rhizobacter sp. J219 TaxID=2898430 RepID=UPI002151D030|nr:methylated-DNA--[protein]-cysteine S-methyltransferase [Rhizobacter sp. J219]MCR5882909.1 methylated-DNA--[protein]-cysteine S-methyltransferase [Rhizobacter sp. J219]